MWNGTQDLFSPGMKSPFLVLTTIIRLIYCRTRTMFTQPRGITSGRINYQLRQFELGGVDLRNDSGGTIPCSGTSSRCFNLRLLGERHLHVFPLVPGIIPIVPGALGPSAVRFDLYQVREGLCQCLDVQGRVGLASRSQDLLIFVD